MDLYLIEVTDTFAGDANYSWVRRYAVRAESVLGALQKLSKHEGYRFRSSGGSRYDARGACICAFVKRVDAVPCRYDYAEL